MNLADGFFFASKALAVVVLPPTGFLLLALLALFVRRRWPRTSLVTLWTSCLSLMILSLPVVADLLMHSLYVGEFDKSQVHRAQAIVILGGGLRRDTPEFGDTLAPQSLDRVRYGAILHHRYQLPILVTGGTVFGGRPEGDLMAEMLNLEFKTPAQWIEKQARHTAENARYSAKVLAAVNIHTVILVTHDYHMKRAMTHCAAVGLSCIPAPVSLSGSVRDSWIQHMPNISSLHTSSMALHEYLGLVAAGLR